MAAAAKPSSNLTRRTVHFVDPSENLICDTARGVLAKGVAPKAAEAGEFGRTTVRSWRTFTSATPRAITRTRVPQFTKAVHRL